MYVAGVYAFNHDPAHACGCAGEWVQRHVHASVLHPQQSVRACEYNLAAPAHVLAPPLPMHVSLPACRRGVCFPVGLGAVHGPTCGASLPVRGRLDGEQGSCNACLVDACCCAYMGGCVGSAPSCWHGMAWHACKQSPVQTVCPIVAQC